ncbi:hypothetical protein L1049_001762 [Liquidambar formosana]|uniref:Uncharacterized protein n=1 Tax=Liquidambar formosana TaxID=63359 RepID=A0AAP0N1E8_LIQFO
MAGLSAIRGVNLPVRSISLPSRLHPNSLKIEAELNKLKTWESSSASTTAPLGAETIKNGLVQLAGLYNCVEELIHSPLMQQALLQHQPGKVMEEALDESIGLLDVCGNARDLFLMMKEHVQDLQSALRRKGGVSSIESDLQAYICFRKKVKKDIGKCLRALRRTENNFGSFPLLDVNNSLSMVIRMLREVSTITISIFRSLLLSLSMPVMNTKAGGWSLIQKLMPTGLIASERSQKIINEVGSVDFALYALHGRIRKNDTKKIDVQMEQRRLETLDASIKGLEAGLDCLFRRLIQHRVSLLNILTH